MLEPTRRALVRRFDTHDSVVEVAIGRRVAVARSLAEAGVSVTATDICEREVPPGVTFVRDDVTNPERGVYDGADLLYALNLPPELHRPLARLADRVDAACCFTTLGADQPVVPVERVSLPEETLYLVSGSQGF